AIVLEHRNQAEAQQSARYRYAANRGRFRTRQVSWRPRRRRGSVQTLSERIEWHYRQDGLQCCWEGTRKQDEFVSVFPRCNRFVRLAGTRSLCPFGGWLRSRQFLKVFRGARTRMRLALRPASKCDGRQLRSIRQEQGAARLRLTKRDDAF